MEILFARQATRYKKVQKDNGRITIWKDIFHDNEMSPSERWNSSVILHKSFVISFIQNCTRDTTTNPCLKCMKITPKPYDSNFALMQSLNILIWWRSDSLLVRKCSCAFIRVHIPSPNLDDFNQLNKKRTSANFHLLFFCLNWK